MSDYPGTERMPELPAPLRTLRALRALNIAAVGLSLGAIVSACFCTQSLNDPSTLATGVSTLVVGSVWASLFRSRRYLTLGGHRLPISWVVAIPLAMGNSGLSFAIDLALVRTATDGSVLKTTSLGEMLGPFFLGATFGAIVWVPALIATVVVFGLPLERARALAAKGLAGEERGEKIVGTVCALVGAVAIAIALGTQQVPHGAGWTPCALGLLGGSAGAIAAVLAWAREARRRAFVARVETGSEIGYRIDATSQGKVLMRVTSQGEGYRVADFEEPIAELGELTASKRS